MRVAKTIHLTDEDRATLTKWSPARLTQRARIVPAAAHGLENQEIALMLRYTRRTASTWRNRFAASGLSGIQQDAPRGGRTPVVRGAVESEIIRKTTQETLH